MNRKGCLAASPLGPKPKKVLVKGLPVHIAEEERLVLEMEGKALKVEEYVAYRLAGVEDIENPMAFELSLFDRMGGIHEAERRFGTIDKLKIAIAGVRKRLYIHT